MEQVIVEACRVSPRGPSSHDRSSTLTGKCLRLTYQFCKRCGLIFQDPKFSDAALETYYHDHYHDQMMPEREDIQRNLWVQEQHAQSIAEIEAEFTRDPKVYVDIGASRGRQLAYFQGRLGPRVVGVEPGKELRQGLTAEGYQVGESIAALPGELWGSVDLVTMSHVLDHLAYPADYVRALR